MITTIQCVRIVLDPATGQLMVISIDPVIECPLDSSHRIKSSQIQCHLERCLIGDLIKMKCPWNSLHEVDESSYDYHIGICGDKPPPESEKENTEPAKTKL